MTVHLPNSVVGGGLGAREEAFLKGQQLVLERVAVGASLAEVLERIVRLIEAQSAEMLCSILLVDRDRQVVRQGAGPSLPESFNRAIDQEPIGPTAGTCGAAAYRGEVVEVEDIATHPNWERYRDVALAHGLRASWSTPIFSAAREVVGTFAMYYRTARLPNADERRWVAAATHLAGIAISANEARAVQAQLVNSEAELRALFDHSAIGIALIGADGSFVRVNPALCRFFGYEAAEFASLTPSGLTYPDDLITDLALAQELISGQRDSYQIEKRYLRKDGAVVWARFTASIVRSATHREGMLAIGMLEDISVQKRLEAQILRSQRLEGLSRLAGGLAHDFNNVLTAIQGSAQLALEELGAGHPARESLGDIELATGRATELVRRILAFSPDAEPQRVVQSLGPIVQEVLRLFAGKLPANISLREELGDAVLQAKVDATQMHQLLMNLMTNALHAMPDGGTIAVGLEPRVIDHCDGPSAAGSWACLAVSDTGVGIPKALQDQVFEPFFTTKTPGRGTGLGLAIVHAIAHAHDGHVRVQSAPGEGSTFEVLLPIVGAIEPRAAKAAAVQRSVEAPASAARIVATRPGKVRFGRGERVLFVDDEAIIGRLVKRELEAAGYVVTAFEDPVDAVAAFKARPDAFDALVTDASMPRLSGFDVAREVRVLRAVIPIIVISGGLWNRESHEVQSLRIGELLLKPQALRELAPTLRRLLDGADG